MIQTAGGVATNLARRTAGTFPANTGDWTIFLRFKYPSTPGAATDVSLFNLFDGATDFTDPYLHVGSQVATGDIGLDVFANPAEFQSTFTPVTNTTQYWAAVTYNHTTTTCTWYVDGVAIDAGTIDLSAITWDSLYVLGDGFGGNSTAACAIAYHRAWSSVLSVAALTLEAASVTAVEQTGLLWDAPLQTSVDLTSHGTANPLTAVGTVTTDTTDPLISVIAGPPTNLDPSTAMTVTVDSAVFQDTLTAGASTSVWFKCTAPLTASVMGACAYGGSGTYTPNLGVYEGFTNADNGDLLLTISSINKPVQFPVLPGTDYYFGALKVGSVTPATVQFSVLVAPDVDAPAGSFVINDDTAGFPAAILRQSDGAALTYVKPFPNGEGADILPDGTMLFVDEDALTLKLYDSAFALQTSIPFVHGSALQGPSIRSNKVDTFYVGSPSPGPAFATIQTVSAAGAVVDTWTLTAAPLIGIAPSNDETLAYVTGQGGATVPAIKVWDLVNSVFLADLTAGVVNHLAPEDLLVFPDDSIVTVFDKVTVTRNTTLVQYSAAGAALQTTDYGVGGSSFRSRLAYDLTDFTHFWLWRHLAGGVERFAKVRLVDFVEVAAFEVPAFEQGIYSKLAEADPQRFEASQSCPFLLLQESVIPPPTPTTTTFTIRRQRRWLLPQSESNKRIQIPLMELLMRTGIGLLPDAAGSSTPIGVDPEVRLRISKDGGKTWGPERARSAGLRGEFKDRVRWTRATGNYRNGVGEVTVDAPVDWQWLAMMGDPTEGSS